MVMAGMVMAGVIVVIVVVFVVFVIIVVVMIIVIIVIIVVVMIIMVVMIINMDLAVKVLRFAPNKRRSNGSLNGQTATGT
jgi:hypothetical protein